MKVWAVVPAKGFDTAKSRLEGVLDAEARRELARTMFEHVLGVLRSSDDVLGVTVITNSNEIAEAAAAAGAIALRDPPHASTLAEIVDHALDDVARRTNGRALVLMGDLPELTATDLARVVGELDDADVVLVRDARGAHTNALGTRLDRRLPTRFGAPDSFALHAADAERAGLSTACPDVPTVAFDLDTPEDYARWTRARTG